MFTLKSSNFAQHTVFAMEIQVPDLELHLTSADTLALGSMSPLLESWKAPGFKTCITPSYTRFHWTFRNNPEVAGRGFLAPFYKW